MRKHTLFLCVLKNLSYCQFGIYMKCQHYISDCRVHILAQARDGRFMGPNIRWVCARTPHAVVMLEFGSDMANMSKMVSMMPSEIFELMDGCVQFLLNSRPSCGPAQTVCRLVCGFYQLRLCWRNCAAYAMLELLQVLTSQKNPTYFTHTGKIGFVNSQKISLHIRKF